MDYPEKLVKVKAALLAMQRMSWEHGVAAQAFFEIGDNATGILLAREAVHRQHADGRLANTWPDECLDPGANGGPVLAAYQLTGEPIFKHAADRMADYFLNRAPRTSDGTLHHTTQGHFTLVDGIYHLAPFLALAGYPQEAVRQIEGIRKIHFLPHKKLYAQMWDVDKQVFSRGVCWGGAQGWMAGALMRVLQALPPSMAAENRRLAAYLNELVDSCLAHLRPDGLFHDVIDDPATFVETTAGLMLAYAIYRGMQAGWLEGSYAVSAGLMRAAGYAKVDENGILQGAAGAPDFQHQGTSAEAQAFLILAEAAYQDYLRTIGK